MELAIIAEKVALVHSEGEYLPNRQERACGGILRPVTDFILAARGCGK